MHNKPGAGPTRTDKTLDRIAQQQASAGVAKDGRPHAGSPGGVPIPETPADDPAPNEERIRQAAYELYLQRGSADGRAEEDWLEAERTLRTDARSAR